MISPIFVGNSGLQNNPPIDSKLRFSINGYLWIVSFVSNTSPYLIDRTGRLAVATTDPSLKCIFLSDELYGSFLRTVLLHELGHVTMFSYGLLPVIHDFVKPSKWIEAEEWVCNFIADYGDEVFKIASDILSSDEGGAKYARREMHFGPSERLHGS